MKRRIAFMLVLSVVAMTNAAYAQSSRELTYNGRPETCAGGDRH